MSTFGVPRAISTSASAPTVPAMKRPASSSKLRASYAPSPLSLPHNNIMVPGGIRSPISPIPPSPTLARHPLRQMTSRSIPNETPNSGTASRPLATRNGNEPSNAPAPALHKQQSLQSVNGRVSISQAQNATTNTTTEPVGWVPRPSVDSDAISLTSTRSQVTSPVGRQPSLRSKLSLPNLKRHQSRQGSVSSTTDMVQVADMDFELVRPSMTQIHGRSSEDSSFVVREASTDTKQGSFLRTDSPAMSISLSSGQRSPVVSDSGSWPRTAKASDSESSIDAHRQRELKWVSLMSSVPAAQSRKSKKVKKLLLDGVPSSVRYLVWSHLMDGKARNVNGVYTQLGQRGRVPAFGEIERDVRRCFADHPQLLSTQGPLLSLLQAYLCMVPDIQYTTGEHNVVLLVLLLMQHTRSDSNRWALAAPSAGRRCFLDLRIYYGLVSASLFFFEQHADGGRCSPLCTSSRNQRCSSSQEGPHRYEHASSEDLLFLVS